MPRNRKKKHQNDDDHHDDARLLESAYHEVAAAGMLNTAEGGRALLASTLALLVAALEERPDDEERQLAGFKAVLDIAAGALTHNFYHILGPAEMERGVGWRLVQAIARALARFPCSVRLQLHAMQVLGVLAVQRSDAQLASTPTPGAGCICVQSAAQNPDCVFARAGLCGPLVVQVLRAALDSGQTFFIRRIVDTVGSLVAPGPCREALIRAGLLQALAEVFARLAPHHMAMRQRLEGHGTWHGQPQLPPGAADAALQDLTGLRVLTASHCIDFLATCLCCDRYTPPRLAALAGAGGYAAVAACCTGIIRLAALWPPRFAQLLLTTSPGGVAGPRDAVSKTPTLAVFLAHVSHLAEDRDSLRVLASADVAGALGAVSTAYGGGYLREYPVLAGCYVRTFGWITTRTMVVLNADDHLRDALLAAFIDAGVARTVMRLLQPPDLVGGADAQATHNALCGLAFLLGINDSDRGERLRDPALQLATALCISPYARDAPLVLGGAAFLLARNVKGGRTHLMDDPAARLRPAVRAVLDGLLRHPCANSPLPKNACLLVSALAGAGFAPLLRQLGAAATFKAFVARWAPGDGDPRVEVDALSGCLSAIDALTVQGLGPHLVEAGLQEALMGLVDCLSPGSPLQLRVLATAQRVAGPLPPN